MRGFRRLLVLAWPLTIASIAAVVAQTSPPRAGGRERPAIAGLDHIPIAVADLESAAARYRELGFSLKPGRPHGNGIRNEHAKFPDGTELELISAPEATDALTAKYRRHLARGDGPAFLALFAPSLDAVGPRLDVEKIRYRRMPPVIDILEDPLDYVFIGPRNQSPTDRPEHFAHANTAQSLVAVWLAGDDLGAERRLLAALGAALAEETVHVPEPLKATVARLPEGEVVLLPGSHQLVPGRRIVGATLRVRSAGTAAAVLERLPRWLRPRRVSDGKATSLFLAPAAAHGLWLELRQVHP